MDNANGRPTASAVAQAAAALVERAVARASRTDHGRPYEQVRESDFAALQALIEARRIRPRRTPRRRQS